MTPSSFASTIRSGFRDSPRRPLRASWLMVGAALLGLSASTAYAAYYSVNIGGDNGHFMNGVGSGNAGDLRYCISQANQNPGSTIGLFYSVTITRELPPITTNMTIEGDNVHTIDAGFSGRVFFVDAPGESATFRNLILKDARAKGGNGGLSAGGGAGLGGAIFINRGSVLLDRVGFNNVAAVGGNGGTGTLNNQLPGGGGGLGGHGGGLYGGGGGFRGNGGDGGDDWNGTSAGGGGGGISGNGGKGHTLNNPLAGGGGGGTTDASHQTPGTGGGIGGNNGGAFGSGNAGTSGSDGALYGGGGGSGKVMGVGTGGIGGRYGGGGGACSNISSAGGNGGDFGGGGAGGYSGTGGNGGFGGGGGAVIGPSISPGSPGMAGFGGGWGKRTNFGGDGGSAFGGAIFVRANAGASLEFSNCTLNAGTLTAGTGGANVSSAAPGSGGNGQVGGSGVYVVGNSTLRYTTTNDESVQGTIAGSANSVIALRKAGNAALTLTAPNFHHSNQVSGGTLRLSGAGTLGVSTASVSQSNNGSIDLNGTSQTIGGLIDTTGVAPSGAIYNGATGTTSTLTIGEGNSDAFYLGRIENGAGTMKLVKQGTGTHTFLRASTFTGGTTISAGTLCLDTSAVAGPLLSPNGPITVAAGAKLLLVGNNYNAIFSSPLTVRGTVDSQGAQFNQHTLSVVNLDGGTITGINPDPTWGNYALFKAQVSVTQTSGVPSTISAPVLQINDAGGPNTIDVAAGATLNISSLITDAAFNGTTYAATGTLNKTGAGTLRLTQYNTHSGGTNVSGGVLSLEGSVDQSVGVIRGTLTIQSGAKVNCVVGNALGYGTGQNIEKVIVNGGTLDNLSAADMGWGIEYILNGGVLTSNGGVASTTTSSKFAFGGAAGKMTSITVPVDATPEIRGRVVLRSDSGNSNMNVDVGANAFLRIFAAVTADAAPVSITKVGTGTLVLNAANDYTGATLINAGTVALGAGGNLGANGAININSGATLDLTALGANGFTLPSGRSLTNSGTILGLLKIDGTIAGNGTLHGGVTINPGGSLIRNSGTMVVNGTITNHGTMRFSGGASLNAGGATSFVNHGIIDLITAGPNTALPANFTNGPGGVVITASDVKVRSLGKAANTVTVVVKSFAGHTYHLHRASDLASPFQPVPGSASQAGTGGDLTFTDLAANGAQGFYRVVIDP